MNIKELNLEYLGLIILALFPIFPYTLISISLTFFCVLTIIKFIIKKGKRTINESFKKEVLKIIFFYIFLLLFTVVKEKSFSALNSFQASLPILAFGFVWYFFSSFSLSKMMMKNISYVFVFSSFVLGCIITINSFFIEIGNLTFFNVFRNSLEKIDFLDLHPVYVSIYFLFANMILIHNISKKKRYLFFSLILFFTILLILIASRIAIITFLIILSYKLFSTKKKVIALSFLSLFFSIFIISIIVVKPLQKQFNEISSFSKLELPYKKFPTSPQIRLGIYKCSYEIIKEHCFFGTGANHFQSKLEYCYDRYNNYDKIKYNTHNYYIFLVGSCGLIGLFLFLYSLITQFKIAKKTQNEVFVSFIIIIFIFLFTENILIRSHGATFFVFCLSLFLLSDKKVKEN